MFRSTTLGGAMRKILGLCVLGMTALPLDAAETAATTGTSGLTASFQRGKPDMRSMSALAFGPEGILFIGDGKGGAVFALDLGDRTAPAKSEPLSVPNIETKVAALLGTTSDAVLIHDMAVNPVSQQTYLAVSRERGKWMSGWELPNDIGDAQVLLRIDTKGGLHEVALDDVSFSTKKIPNPVDPAKTHVWKKGLSLRADTITDMAYAEGTLFVAGLSNEEFASTMWRVPFPFAPGTAATTLEIFHGAHGKYETHAPIRTFVPYRMKGRSHLLAAYLCTPLVTFETDKLIDGTHVKGRTIAEFGSGNYPLDMVVYEKDGEQRLLIANSNLPYMVVKTKDIDAYEGSITQEVEGYLAGVPWEPRSGSGIQQFDRLGSEYFVALQRLPGGTLDLITYPLRRF